MQMNKGELRGFSHVFRFTLIQAIRSKSLVITMVKEKVKNVILKRYM